MREFWGPPGRGRESFCQRLFKVLFEDGSSDSLVAEDLVDGCAEPFEDNAFYAKVLQDWRKEHSKAAQPAIDRR